MFLSPKWLLHLEGLAVFLTGIFLYHTLGGSWLKFALFFFVPDVFMLGYFFGPKAGAAVYNVGHTYTAPFLFSLVGYLAHAPSLFYLSIIWTAHIGFDRMLGYGLKYPAAFKSTHLGKV